MTLTLDLPPELENRLNAAAARHGLDAAAYDLRLLEATLPPAVAHEEHRYPLRGTVLRYDDPTEPVASEDWNALR